MARDTVAAVRRDMKAIEKRLQKAEADADEMKRNLASIVSRGSLGVEVEPEPVLVPPVNTVLPTISAATEGVATTGTDGTWTGSPTFAYQWLLDGIVISGATAASYTPAHGDVGHQLARSVSGTANGLTVTATSAAVTVAAAGGGGGPIYTQDFSGGIGSWTESALPAPSYTYTELTVVTGVVSSRVRMAVASGKEYATIHNLIPGLTAGQQYTATVAFANRTGLVWVSVVTDKTTSRSTVNRAEEASASSGSITLVFTASTTNYFRIRLQTETAGASLDVASVSISASSTADPNFAGAFWRTDRRPILREFIAEVTQRRFPLNPRGWLPDTVGNAFNAATFDAILQARADQVGAACVAAGAQGLVVWDLTGQEFAQFLSYFGNPDEIAALAPEITAIVSGETIVKRFLDKIKSYGLRIGCTLRPQHVQYGTSFPMAASAAEAIQPLYPFIKTDEPPPGRHYVASGGSWLTWEPAHNVTDLGAGQLNIYTGADATAAQQRLIDRITYCKNTWGMSLFYVDTTVWENGDPLPGSLWAAIQAAHPDVLIMPENEDGYTYHPYSVPYGELDAGDVGPQYFSTNPDAMMLVALDQSVDTAIFNDAKALVMAQYAAKRLLLMAHWGDEPRLAMIAEIMAG